MSITKTVEINEVGLTPLEQSLVNDLARLEADNRRLRGVLLEHGYRIAGVDPDPGVDPPWRNELAERGILAGRRSSAVECLKQAVADNVCGVSEATRHAVLTVIHLEGRVVELEKLAAENDRLGETISFNRTMSDGNDRKSKKHANELIRELDCWKNLALARAVLLDPANARKAKLRQSAEESVARSEQRLKAREEAADVPEL